MLRSPADTWTFSPISLLFTDAEMLFWGLDNTLDTWSAYPCCPLSPRPFPMRAWLTKDLPPWVFPCLDCWVQYWSGEQLYRTAQSFSLKAHGCFFPEKKKPLKRQGLPWLNVLLCSCVSVFPKLNCTWTHVVIHSPSILWLNFQASPGSSVALVLWWTFTNPWWKQI